MPPLLSVCIPARNAAAHVAEQLQALAEQQYPGDWELVVADNGSSDATVEIVRSFGDRLPGLEIVAEPRMGVGFARTAAVAASRGEWIGFLDADDVVAPGWLAAMAAALEDHAFVCGAVDRLDPGGADHHRINPFPSSEADGPEPAFGFLPFAPSGNMAVWASALTSAGGFNPRKGSGEDVDLSWRLQLAGYPLHFAPDAVLYYRYRATRWETLRQTMFYARAHPYLYRRFRTHGMARRSGREVARDVWRLTRRVVQLPRMSSARRQSWLTDVANLAGRVAGSIQHRTLYL